VNGVRDATGVRYAVRQAQQEEPAVQEQHDHVTATTGTPASGAASPAPTGRRARQRQATLADLQRAALAEVRERGAVGLSLRSVARRLGMSPAGLYRYVGSREDLLTMLIADGYHDLADHLLASIGDPASPVAPDRPAPEVPSVAGPDEPVTERLRAVAQAYRAWAVTHPNEFALLFGDPIPGYEAPAGGPTVAAMRRVGEGLARPLLEAWHQGGLRTVPEMASPALVAALGPMAQVGGDLPTEAYTLLLLTWGRLHGQVSLEVFGHHRWILPDGCAPLFDAEVEALLVDLGVTEAG
jgi:AcrR family transcriptional regulator